MAENEERSTDDLTEEESSHRLEEFRQKGMVAQSRELTGLLTLTAVGFTTYALASDVASKIIDFMREVFDAKMISKIDLSSTHLARKYISKSFSLILDFGLPICGAGFIVGILGSFSQVGPLFTMIPLSPDFSKIDPFQSLKKIFSKKQLIETLRIFLKLTLMIALVFPFLKNEILSSSLHFWSEPLLLLTQYGIASKWVFFTLISVMSFFAAIDFWMQRFEMKKNIRMTKQEAKQEMKEREGNPQTRSRIRSIQRQMARRRMMSAVKKADVLVTNPTHIAIALAYDKDSMSAPRVVAKGADLIAEKMKKIAQEAGVPLVENVPLARTLFKTVKIGQAIPRPLYQAVAEVLAYVYKLKKRFT